MSKHTPGPWRKCGGMTPRYTAIQSSGGFIVFQMADSGTDKEHGRQIAAPDMDTQQANACLIAAAPELLEALQLLVHAVAARLCTDDEIELARTAIAKAQGT